jgi:hypothetical protein
MESSGNAAVAVVGGLLVLAVAVLLIAAIWRVFTKASQPGWAAIIPIYNTIVLLRVAGKPWWWLLLMLIPLVNTVIVILTLIGLADNFGKGVGFVLGLVFLSPIFILILGFGGSTYQPMGVTRNGPPLRA